MVSFEKELHPKGNCDYSDKCIFYKPGSHICTMYFTQCISYIKFTREKLESQQPEKKKESLLTKILKTLDI